MKTPLSAFTRVLLIVVLASLAFGGSFECRSSTHDDDNRAAK